MTHCISHVYGGGGGGILVCFLRKTQHNKDKQRNKETNNNKTTTTTNASILPSIVSYITKQYENMSSTGSSRINE